MVDISKKSLFVKYGLFLGKLAIADNTFGQEMTNCPSAWVSALFTAAALKKNDC